MTRRLNRGKLEFAINAVNAFNFLVDSYGFVLSIQNEYLVRFESDNVSVIISHGRLSYEISFSCSLKNVTNSVFYQLPIILKALEATIPKIERGYYQAHKKQSIKMCLIKLAHLVQVYCIPLLEGDKNTYEIVELCEQKISKKTTLQYSLSHKKKEVEVVWGRKNYVEVKSMYESFPKPLTTLEKRRLNYAIKKIKN
jgi:hypothetical protein